MPPAAHIELDTPHGTQRVYPKKVTGVALSRYADSDICIYHGQANAANVYLDWDAAKELIARTRKPSNCPAYRGACYGRRETETVLPDCLGCRLRKLSYEAGKGDYRDVLYREEHPLKVPVVVVCVLFVSAVVWSRSERDSFARLEAENRRLRMERRQKYPAVTFTRQVQKRGKP